MGVMQKMRKNTGVILWVLIFSFGILWMLADTNIFDIMHQGPRSLGSVNGEEVSMEEYNNRTNYFIQRYTETTDNTVTPEMRAVLKDRAWDEIVIGKLMQQRMDQLGIKVTDQEVVDMITGENPDPFIRRQFQREDGTLDRVALKTAVEAPENKELWLAIEKQMRQKKRQQKMNSYLQSSLEVSQSAIEREYIQNNTTADFSYVRFPYSEVSEDEISVTEEDLKKYYEDHKQLFEREKSYRFGFVSFDKSPTKEDTTRTFEEVENLRNSFIETDNDSLFFETNESALPYDPKEVDKSELRDLFDPVKSLENGEVSEIISDDGRLFLLKKLSESNAKIKYLAYAKDVKADPVATIDEQAMEAEDFSFYATEDGFQKEAERNDKAISEGFATEGNNVISGIGPSQQVMEFLKNADEGSLSDPIELEDQFIVIHVREIVPSGPEPFDQVKDQIRSTVKSQKRKDQARSKVDGRLAENSDPSSLAEAANKDGVEIEGLSRSAESIPGAGREPTVIGALFGLEEGEHSQPIEGTSAVFVVRLNNLEKAELTDLT